MIIMEETEYHDEFEGYLTIEKYDDGVINYKYRSEDFIPHSAHTIELDNLMLRLSLFNYGVNQNIIQTMNEKHYELLVKTQVELTRDNALECRAEFTNRKETTNDKD